MFKKHTTKEGRKMLICEMDDSHLSNTINLILNDLEQVNNVLDGKGEYFNIPSSIASMAGFDSSRVNRAKYEGHQKSLLGVLYPYLAEAFLRGLDNTRLRDVMNRNGALILNLPPSLRLDGGRCDSEDASYFDDVNCIGM